MKRLFISLITIFIFNSANAMLLKQQNDGFQLPESADGLSVIENAQVTDVQYDIVMCPMVMGTNCVGGPVTVVAIKFELSGCMDELSPVTYDVMEGNDSRRKILLSAHNIHVRMPEDLVCTQIVHTSQEVYVRLTGYIPAEKITLETLKPANREEPVQAIEPGAFKQLILAEKAKVVDVNQTENNGTGRTTIRLTMPYTCGNVLSHINVRTRPLQGNKMIVYVSALEADLGPDELRCKALPSAEFNVSVPGNYSKRDIRVINLSQTAH